MKKTVVALAAVVMMMGGTFAFAQQPEGTEAPATEQPAPTPASDEPKSDEGKADEQKGDNGAPAEKSGEEAPEAGK